MNADERAKLVEKQILEIWDSLQSHLYGMYHKTPEGRIFHKRCVKDYAKQLFDETKLL